MRTKSLIKMILAKTSENNKKKDLFLVTIIFILISYNKMIKNFSQIVNSFLS